MKITDKMFKGQYVIQFVWLCSCFFLFSFLTKNISKDKGNR